jgi:predicted nucleic acid-binding protein
LIVILLDTNVISEAFKARPEPRVADWLASVPIEHLFVSSISKAEMLYGLALMSDGARKQALASVIQEFLKHCIVNPITSFGERDAVEYARISAHRRKIGRRIRELDAQIAAIARSHGFAVATRNIRDFEGCGIELINPWGTPRR